MLKNIFFQKKKLKNTQKIMFVCGSVGVWVSGCLCGCVGQGVGVACGRVGVSVSGCFFPVCFLQFLFFLFFEFKKLKNFCKKIQKFKK